MVTHSELEARPNLGVGRSLVDFLYAPPARRDVVSILAWWEQRRLPFNLIVGGSGLIAMGMVSVAIGLPPSPWIPVVVYGAMANLCFSAGPVLEILIEKLFGRDVLPTGPVLFRAGLTFSIGLTLVFPTIMVVMTYLFRILGWIF